MVKPQHEYRNILQPSIDRLLGAGQLLIDAQTMSEFLGIERSKTYQLMGTDRMPLPIHLGFGGTPRWSVLELLEWVEAGCPGRGDWIDHRGWSGWARERSHGLPW